MLGLVHDYLLVLRGAERTFLEMASTWPDAPIATIIYDQALVREKLPEREIRTSALQRLAPTQANFRRLMPLLGRAAARLAVDDWDVIVSSSSAFAHGIHPASGAVHLCYCHSPFRYAWHELDRAVAQAPAALSPAMRALLAAHRRFDHRATQRVTSFVANAAITRERIKRFWGRDSTIVHPPVEVARFSLAEPEEYFLVVGEVTAHKQTELALAAAQRAQALVKVVGTGPMVAKLKRGYPSADFLGRIDDAALAKLYASARATIIPNVEEFGIVAVEAQAAGRPVLAAGAGGALETVVADRTGAFFEPGSVAGLAKLMRMSFEQFDPQDIQAHAAQFAPERFRHQILDSVLSACEQVRRPDLHDVALRAAQETSVDRIGPE